MGDEVVIREVGLRDGLQLVSDFVATETKMQWITRQAELGFSHIEVTSFVPPKLLPQFRDAAEVVGHSNRIAGLNPSALVLNTKGASNAWEAGATCICFVVSASEQHNQSNVRCSSDQSLEMFREIAGLVQESNTDVVLNAAIATSFGCSLQGDVAESRVLEIANSLASSGAREITLADTVGYANPRQVSGLFARVQREIGDVPLAAHFHDTRGMGLANVSAALEAGVRIFDAALGGLGGCPFAPGATGNIATEDTVYMLQSMGLNKSIDFDGLLSLRADLSQWLARETLHGKLATAGPAKNFNP